MIKKSRLLIVRAVFIFNLFSALALFVSDAVSDDVKIHPDAGKTSATFLKIGAGARAAGMANAFAGVSDDATAIYWNPAGLDFAKEGTFEINASHNEWFESVKHDFVGFSFKKKDSKVALGGAFYGLYIPSDIERRTGVYEDDPFEPLTAAEGYFGAYDMALSFGAAYRPGKTLPLSIGASIKVINQTIDNFSGYGAAADFGAIYYPSNLAPFTFAAVFQNMGTPIRLDQKSYPLPFTARFAVSYRKEISDEKRPLNLSFETAFPIDNYPFFYLGGEYFIAKIFALRAGYRYRLYGLEVGDINGLAAGAGIKIPIAGKYEISLDYAFNPYGILGNSHRISAGMRFGGLSAGKMDSSAGKSETALEGLRQSEQTPRPVKSPQLPTEPIQLSRDSSEIPAGGELAFRPTDITFKPKIVSNALTVAEFTAVSSSVGDNTPISAIKATGILRTRRTLPSDKELKNSRFIEVAALNSAQDKLLLYFRQGEGLSVKMENISVTISLLADKKIKAIYTQTEYRTIRKSGKMSSLPFELKSASPDGRTNIYEIRMPSLSDIVVEFAK